MCLMTQGEINSLIVDRVDVTGDRVGDSSLIVDHDEAFSVEEDV